MVTHNWKVSRDQCEQQSVGCFIPIPASIEDIQVEVSFQITVTHLDGIVRCFCFQSDVGFVLETYGAVLFGFGVFKHTLIM
jgi:hypothetical protein